MPETKVYTELRRLFTEYLVSKSLRKTEERYTIFEQMCMFPGHFDMDMLHVKLEEANYHVSKATLYNTLDVLLDAGLIVRHHLSTQIVQYELRIFAETHQHLICSMCGTVREMKNQALKASVESLKTPRFTPEFYSLYIYGLCSKCKYKQQRMKK